LAENRKEPIVYIVGPSFRTQGGISSVLLIYYNHFKDLLNMRFITSYSGNSRIKDLFYFATALLQVFFICISGKHAVFHIHSSTYGSFLRKSMIARLCLFFRREVIFHIHGADFDTFMEKVSSRWKGKIIKLLNQVDQLVVLSDSWKAFFIEYVSAEKIKVIVNPSSTYNPVYIKRRNPRVKVLFIGRIGRRKGAYDLIEAVKKIRFLNFSLDLVGDGEGDKIRNIAGVENLTGIVKVYDWVSHKDVGKLYDKADILVLPSYAEGLPMSILEAIGKGLPVISTNVGGIPEMIIDGRNGFIVEPGDIDALSEKMRVLISNAALREEMGKNSLKITEEKFTIEQNCNLLKKLYNRQDSRTGRCDGRGGVYYAR
jgi:glycosyltransferase involved in cell wall biosynthesis